MRRFKGRAGISVLLASLLGAPAWPQTGDLRIVVLEGEGGVHNIRRKAVSPVLVEVRDDRNRPVENARVRFTMPELGPGGRFMDGMRSLEMFTDIKGRAGFDSFVPNEQEGRFSVVVQAASLGRESGTAVSQTNSRFHYSAPRWDAREVPGKSNTRALTLVLGVGAAVTLGGVLASRGGGGPQKPPVSIGVGGVSIDGPR